MSRRTLPTLAAVALTVGLVGIPGTAFAHANVNPSAVEPGATTQFTLGALVERPEAMGLNARFEMHVPRDWGVVSCDLPVHWDCTIDRDTYAPDTVLIWEPTASPLPTDVNGFAFTATAPETAGTWMLRTLQTHFDGWTDPWVYDADPYRSPRVVVGGGENIVNPEGSEFDPPCFGPEVQPNGSDNHDGRARDEGCVVPTSDEPEPASDADESGDQAAEPDTAPVAAEQPTIPATGVNTVTLLFLALAMIGVGQRCRVLTESR